MIGLLATECLSLSSSADGLCVVECLLPSTDTRAACRSLSACRPVPTGCFSSSACRPLFTLGGVSTLDWKFLARVLLHPFSTSCILFKIEY